MSQRKAKKASDDFTKMARAVAVYLEHVGWKVIVAGPSRVQQWPGERKYSFEFVLPFTGTKITKAGKPR